jgi:hypothetical protein
MSFCESLKILIKLPSKNKMLRSITVEEVGRTDERVDMGKLICRSTFRRGHNKKGSKMKNNLNHKLAFVNINLAVT